MQLSCLCYSTFTILFQEAEKGVIFTSFPPILHPHLMRFQYDPATDCSVKCNDRFEFFEKIQLEEFVKDDDSPQPKPTYTLHAVSLNLESGLKLYSL